MSLVKIALCAMICAHQVVCSLQEDHQRHPNPISEISRTSDVITTTSASNEMPQVSQSHSAKVLNFMSPQLSMRNQSAVPSPNSQVFESQGNRFCGNRTKEFFGVFAGGTIVAWGIGGILQVLGVAVLGWLNIPIGIVGGLVLALQTI